MGRIRKIKNANILIQAFPWLIQKPKKIYFTNHNIINLEVGTGRGDFLIKSAIKFPTSNFLGIEKDSTIVLKTLRKLKTHDDKFCNLLVINDDAKNLLNWCEPNSISNIYLNFSDPWPKKRHEKNRLTSKTFLNIYEKLLKEYGQVEMKTDNYAFYLYTLENLKQYRQFCVTYKTIDLYEEDTTNNIVTEYEKKFTSLNKKIYKIIFVKNN